MVSITRTVGAVLLFATISSRVMAADIDSMNLLQLREALDRGEVTSEQLVRHFQANIQKDNRQGRHINAVIAVNGKALEQARAWDVERARPPQDHSGPLAGIPFLAKDNFDTRDQVTSGGAYVLRASIPSRNAFAVQRLLDSGAILLGKANMSELAASFGWFGYSSLGGQTLNPLNTKRDASGSSSGSAAAVAARFAPFALGSDTSGSIRGPASVTGTVGLRPSMGLIGRSGVIPLSLTFDTVGVVTRSVADQAIVLDVLKGQDDNDAATQGIAAERIGFVEALRPNALDGKTIGVVTNFEGANAQVDQVFHQAQQRLEGKGANVVSITLPKAYETLWADVLGPVGDSEFKPQFERYLSTLSADQPKTLEQFLARAKPEQSKRDGHPMNPKRFEALEALAGHSQADTPLYISILSNRIPGLRRDLENLMQASGIDGLMFATINCPASVVHGQKDDSFECQSDDTYAAAYIASATGFPEITVPAGTITGGVSVGVSFLGRHGDDAKLVGYGYSFLGR
ncbi:amidase [Pseudomonas sp. I2]|uniref:amidase n=1 Tax=Pseudomonas sp. I2 TaxID=1338438 RepID=UPI0034D6C7F3